MNKEIVSFLSLFFSFGTLLCCALPALLVMFGFGATLASLFSAFPQITVFSEYKAIIFTLAASSVALGFTIEYFNKSSACDAQVLGPASEQSVCEKTKKTSRKLLVVSTVFLIIGFVFAYLLPIFLT